LSSITVRAQPPAEALRRVGVPGPGSAAGGGTWPTRRYECWFVPLILTKKGLAANVQKKLGGNQGEGRRTEDVRPSCTGGRRETFGPAVGAGSETRAQQAIEDGGRRTEDGGRRTEEGGRRNLSRNGRILHLWRKRIGGFVDHLDRSRARARRRSVRERLRSISATGNLRSESFASQAGGPISQDVRLIGWSGDRQAEAWDRGQKVGCAAFLGRVKSSSKRFNHGLHGGHG
jgi:hypothetical protein